MEIIQPTERSFWSSKMPNDESFFNESDAKGGGKIVAIRIIIEGRVQKVGLRHWIKQQAVRFKIYGWGA